MFGLRVPELLLILLIVLLIFGASKLPDIAGALGKSVRELRKGVLGDEKEAGKAPEAKAEAPVSPEKKT